MKKTFKFIAFVAALAMVFTLAACDFLLKGTLKLESFTVDRSSVKTNYLVGEEIDFSGIKATATYSDKSLNKVYTFNELTITYAQDITATVGEKEVKVSFMDPHLNVKQEAVVTIKVTDENSGTSDVSIAVQFEKPDSLVSFDSANNVNTELKYGDAGFAGEFAVGNKTYVVGNENAFRFIPKLAVLNDDDTIEALESFYAVVKMSVLTDDGYVALTATAGEGNLVSFYNGETLIATVDTYKGVYTFSADAEGLTVQISVLPSDEHYIFDSFNPVVLEAKVIKAYNIYEAWELAVVDNDNTDNREEDWDAHAWDAFKNEKGIGNVTVSGIVLHADLTLTADDVPAVFFRTTEKDIVYKNALNPEETITIPAGTKFLKDWSFIYRRLMVADETFVVEGNLFSLNVSQFPLIASPAVFGEEGTLDDYGSDFSNSTLFQFLNDNDTAVENYPAVTVQNLSIIGNAARNNTVDADGNLVSAGGLIFLKATYKVKAEFNNMLGNSFFITYFADQGSIMNVSQVKCYDSYQNAIYMWSNSKATFVDSFFNGAGGPMAIAASPKIDNVYQRPMFVATNTVFETHVSGEEIWFTAVNGNSIVASIKALSEGMKQATLGSLFDNNGKMNIQGLLMPEGSDAAAVITGTDAQGSLFIDGVGMDRNQSAENVQWGIIKQISDYALANGGPTMLPPFLTAYDAQGNAHTIYFNGTTFVDLAGNALNPANAEHLATIMAFQAAERVVLTQGGLSVVLEFYH